MSGHNKTFDISRLEECGNDAYYPYFYNTSRFLVLYGGGGSGKSHFAAQKLLIRIMIAMSEGKRHKFIALRKTQPAVRKSVFALLMFYMSLWGLDAIASVNKSDMTITFPGGSQIICGGLDDREKLKSIEGLTGAWMEEATEFSKEDMIQLNLRIRGVTSMYKQIIFSFNPVDSNSWLNDYFFINTRTNASILKTTYKDNRFIDDEYREELEALEAIDEQYYRIYTLGEWGVLKNLILSNYVIEPCQQSLEYYDDVTIGMDFGYNHASALLVIGWKDGDPYVIREIYEYKKTNSQLIEIAKQEDIPKNIRITADSAEPDRIKEFRTAGFRCVPAVKGKDSVKHGIDYLRRHTIHIDPSCVETAREIKGWKYREDKDGHVYDEPVAINDDAMSALRYAVEPVRLHKGTPHVGSITIG